MILFNRNSDGDLTIISSKTLRGSEYNTLEQRLWNIFLNINFQQYFILDEKDAGEEIFGKIANIEEIYNNYTYDEISDIIKINTYKDYNIGIYRISINLNLFRNNIDLAMQISAPGGIIKPLQSDVTYPIMAKSSLVSTINILESKDVILFNYRVVPPVFVIKKSLLEYYTGNTYENSNIPLNIVDYIDNNFIDIVITQVSKFIKVKEELLNNNYCDSDTLTYLTEYPILLDKNGNIINSLKYTYINSIINFLELSYDTYYPITIRIPYYTAYAIGMKSIVTRNENKPYKMDCSESTVVALNKNLPPDEYIILHTREYPV